MSWTVDALRSVLGDEGLEPVFVQSTLSEYSGDEPRGDQAPAPDAYIISLRLKRRDSGRHKFIASGSSFEDAAGKLAVDLQASGVKLPGKPPAPADQ